MAKQGDVIHNSITKETMLFLKTAADTNGQLLEIEMTVGPGGFVGREHIHPNLAERFQILTGNVALTIDGQQEIVTAGEERTVPKNSKHTWENAGDDELKVILQFRPAGKMEYFLESLFALAETGQSNQFGRPNLLQTAVLFREFKHDVKVPEALPDLMFKLLAPLGRLLGYRAYISLRLPSFATF